MGFTVKTGLYLSYRPANGLSLMHTALLFLVAFHHLWLQLHPQLSEEGDLSLDCLKFSKC